MRRMVTAEPGVQFKAMLPVEQTSRLMTLDALRGVAILWMIAFHLCFDLNHFGLLHPPQQFLADPFWTGQRVCIVGLFMFCAGASQALAHRSGSSWARFWRRWMQVAGCAGLVSVATWFVFPQSWISFGVLHGLAAMVLLARLTASLSPRLLWALGIGAMTLPHLIQHPVFDSRWLNGLGLVTQKPVTEDYAPIFPWMGMVWLGLALGQRLSCLPLTPNPAIRMIALIGQWPLSIYMLHQPLFWGVLLLLSRLGLP
ncbi:MAG: hypothetical protein RIR43_2598 [Pseudomonadota bacterium]|jgi:uncharacterized membrane protein